jgi:hypothetical protein
MDGMNTPEPAGRAPRPSQRVGEARDRFAAAWRAGRTPRIEDYLAEAEETDRPALGSELAALEKDLASRRGQPPKTDECLNRGPAHGGILGPVSGEIGYNLLFGILALQNNFIGRDDLLAAFAA